MNRRSFLGRLVLGALSVAGCGDFGRMLVAPRYPKRTTYESGPWLGVYDTLNADVTREQYLLGATNLWPDPQLAPAWGSRLPWRRIASGITGVSSATVGQGFMTFNANNGVQTPLVMVSGKIFSVAGDGSTNDVTPTATVTVSDSAHRIYGIQYDGTLIVSDGVNRPWKVTSAMSDDPLTGAYLTDAAGAWYGPPVVYYGKVFAINATTRTAIEWSEENDADNGYDVNIWELTQSDPDPLQCLHPTNDTLYYFRTESIGAIRGAVTDDFQTDGVHDGVDNTTGTASPASVVSAGRYVYFADQHGRPCRIVPGLGVERIWMAAGESLGSSGTTTEAAHISAMYDPESGAVVFAHPTTGSTALTLFVFDGESGRFWGRWTLPTGFSTSQFRSLGVQLYLNEGVRTLHVLDQLGNLWGMVPRATTAAVHADNAGSALDIVHTLTLPPLGYDEDTQKQFDRFTINYRSAANAVSQSHTLYYLLPSLASNRTVGASTKAGIAAGLTQKMTWGVNGIGRWFRPVVENTSQLQLGYLDASVEAALLDESPGAY